MTETNPDSSPPLAPATHIHPNHPSFSISTDQFHILLFLHEDLDFLWKTESDHFLSILHPISWLQQHLQPHHISTLQHIIHTQTQRHQRIRNHVAQLNKTQRIHAHRIARQLLILALPLCHRYHLFPHPPTNVSPIIKAATYDNNIVQRGSVSWMVHCEPHSPIELDADQAHHFLRLYLLLTTPLGTNPIDINLLVADFLIPRFTIIEGPQHTISHDNFISQTDLLRFTRGEPTW